MKAEQDKSQTGAAGKLRKRKRFVYLFVIILLIAAAWLIKRGTPQRSESAGDVLTEERRIPVVVMSAAVRNFERRLVVQGNIEAAEFAVVSPRIQGTIENIFVDEGAAVAAGETILFEIDKVNLEKAVTLRRHDLEVAKHARHEKAANLKRVKADFVKTELDYNRYERLFKKGAVTPDAFERQESIYKQSQAGLEHAQALLDLGDEQAKQAEVALAMSEKNLTDAVVYAPINGMISERLHEPGEMGQPGEPIVRIDNLSTIEISAYIPAQYYSEVISNQTQMKVRVSGIDAGRQVVIYKSPTIDNKLRTFEVKCVVNSPPEGVVPGSMAQIVMILEQKEVLGVPSEAIVERGGQSVVFVVSEGVSHQVALMAGLETDGWTEVIDSGLSEESSVVTMGQQMLEDGSGISVQKDPI